MRFGTLIASSLLSVSAVSASVLVITDQPVPTPPSSLSQEEILDDYSELVSRLSVWMESKGGAPFVDRVTSAYNRMDEFVATATYDIPPAVTNQFTETTYTTEPVWWTAVPTDVREVYDQIGTAVASIYSEMYSGAAPTEAARAKAGLGAGLAMAAAAGAVFL